MKARLCSVLFPPVLSLVGLCIALSMPASVFAGVASFTVDFQTVSDSSGSLVKGTVLCDAGHNTVVFGSVTQLVKNQLAQSNFINFVVCEGIIQNWTATLVNTSGVPLKPGRAVVTAFPIDFDDFGQGVPINQLVIIKPATH